MRTTYTLRRSVDSRIQKRHYIVSLAFLSPRRGLYSEALLKINGTPYFVTVRHYRFLWIFPVTQFVHDGELYRSLKALVKALTNTF